jgi:hypothetical protein
LNFTTTTMISSGSSQTVPPAYYDPQTGEPVALPGSDEEGRRDIAAVAQLWQHLSRHPEIAHSTTSDPPNGFDPARVFGPLALAHQQVKALLALVDRLLSDGKSASGLAFKLAKVEGDPRDKEHEREGIDNGMDLRAVYLQSATFMRAKAEELHRQFEQNERLNERAQFFRAQGFLVDWNAEQAAWMVDYGYRPLFAHFWAHLQPMAERGTYAVVNSLDGTLIFAKSIKPRRLTINGLFIFPSFARFDDSSACVNDLKMLQRYQQSLMEEGFLHDVLCPYLLGHFPHARMHTANVLWVPGLAKLELLIADDRDDSRRGFVSSSVSAKFCSALCAYLQDQQSKLDALLPELFPNSS